MKPVTVLLTGAGAPGTKGALYSLKNNFDGRKVRTVGVDIQDDVNGRYFCDSFHRIVKPSEKEFIPLIIDICKDEGVEVVLPQVTEELFPFSERADEFRKEGIAVIVSGKRAIDEANNKYNLMEVSRKLGLPTAEFCSVDTFSDLRDAAKALGWPKKPVVVKPPVASGMRGLRIIDESFDRKSAFYSEKPSGVHVRLEEIEASIGESFPRLMMMEFLPGREYTVDCLQANRLTIIPRSRDLIKVGITFNGTVEKNDAIIESTRRLSERLGLEFLFGFQFKMDEDGVPKVIECNPRDQGGMVMSTFAGANLHYGAVKWALGEDVPEFDVKWGTRMLRYWGGIAVRGGKMIGEII